VNIAELFVTIGLNGNKKTEKDLNKVGNEMKGLSKRALGLFTAIAGISYGLTALSKNAFGTGVGLTKFSNLTGQSVETLQRWQYILRQSSVSAEEVTQNVQQIAQAMAEMTRTGNFSGEFLRIAEITNIDPSKLEDTFYLLEKFREFTRSGLPTSQINSILGTLLSQDVIQGLRTNDMTLDQVPKSAITSDRQAKSLQQAMVRFDNFQKNLEKSVGSVLAKVGPKLATALENLVPVIARLTETILNFLTRFAQFFGQNNGNQSLDQALSKYKDKETSWMDFFLGPQYESVGNLQDIHRRNFPQGYNSKGSESVNSITINQTNNGVSGKDAGAIAQKTSQAVQRAASMQQLKTQAWGN